MPSNIRRIGSAVSVTYKCWSSSSSLLSSVAAFPVPSMSMFHHSHRPLSAAASLSTRATSTVCTPRRCWLSSSAAVAASAPKLAATLQSELQYEKSNYEPAANIATFLEKFGWALTEHDGDVNMTLKKQVRKDLSASVEFQLVSPSYPGEGEEEEGSQVDSQETTDFSVTVEKPNGNGAVFYCTTVGNDEKYRFIVGNVRYFASPEEKSSPSAYNGPEFEDLDDNMQGGIDEWLSSIGINEELCNFIDAMAVDKEQREYMRWLTKIAEIVE